MESGQFVLGPSVAAFEDRFAAYCNAKHCVALNTGTSALHLALLATGIRPGDEVITVDVDPHTWTMDPKLIEAAASDIEDRTHICH